MNKPKSQYSQPETLVDTCHEKGVDIKFVSMEEVFEKRYRYKKLFLLEDTSYVVLEQIHNSGVMNFYYNLVPKVKRVLIPWEPPTTIPHMYSNELLSNFTKVITWNNDLVDNVKFFKCYHYRDSSSSDPHLLNNLQRPMIEDLVSFKDKKLACMFSVCGTSNYPLELYSLRREVISYFRYRPSEFDLFGRNWPENTPNYRGRAFNKIVTAKNYKFNFAMENTKNLSGYMTEKIWDVLVAGSIPIYLGDRDVAKEVPEKCFIDFSKFYDVNHLHNYLINMKEEEYNERIAAIKEFLSSDVAKKYHIDFYSKTIAKVLSK